MGKVDSVWMYSDEDESPPCDGGSWAERTSWRQNWVLPEPLSATNSVTELTGMPPPRQRSSTGQPRVHFWVLK